MDPDGILTGNEKFLLQNVTEEGSVFTPHFSTYNEKSGRVYADVILGKNMPQPQR